MSDLFFILKIVYAINHFWQTTFFISSAMVLLV